MESVLPEKRCVVDGKASQQQEELSSPTKEKLQDDPDRPSMSAKENGTEEEQENEGVEHEEEEDGDSCANSMAHTEKSIGQMNGDADDTDLNVSPKNAVKSPSANRTGRKNQEVKDRSSFICPLCDKNCQTQHYLTMHIRQHNTETGGSDHSCSICGKALSSASSLDRHMLVHSGERPYKCSVCGQTFTTNGNMHRHMKIHDKGPNGIPASRPVSPNKRRKPTKRKLSVEDGVEKTNEPPNKKVFVGRESGKQSPAKHEEDLLHCPICFKTFICKYGLESHMESHPDTALRCNLCCITFRTHRSLLRHNSVIHKQLPTDPNGRPFIQSNPSIPLGFSDLSFIDFSCSKFPQIAQVWCETNLRRCSSKFHRFICEVCNKAFPLQVSLDLHMNSHKDNAAEPQKQQNDTILYTAKDSEDSKEIVESAPQDASVTLNGKNDFMKCLGLQHSSLVKPEESEAEKQQKILNSIRFIRVEPSATNLPQESNSSLGLCLLDPVSLQGLNKSNGLSLLSLQSLQGGLVVRPVSQTGVELADIQQILKMAQITIPSQMTLPLLPKSAEGPLQAEPKQITLLKPKPLVTPRSSMGTSTPSPPVMNAQQASSGCISPSLPPPAAEILTSKQSSNTPSSSTSSSPTNWENTHLVGDGIGATIMTIGDIKQEGLQGKDLRTSGGKKIPKTEYKCRFCTQVFSFPGGLQAHMRAHHYGSSPYKCSICTYTAPDNATLIRHLRTHSGERPYVCRICHYPFTVKANCERHLRKKHMKNTRKEIEKNIEYITTSSSASSVGITQDFVDVANIGNTSCRYCGEDLKTYRALQIHLRTLNGCQRKPFECRQCGAAFLAKRNCIHHLLKQHPEVQEREIEDHINTLVPVTAPSSVQINSPAQSHSGKQNLNTFSETAVQDQPLDFSSKTMKTIHSDVKPAPASPSLLNNSSLEPIDLSIRKILEGKKIKTEQVDTTSLNHQEAKKEVHSSTGKILGTVLGVHASLPASMPSLANTPTNDITKPPIRLKPLLPKPVAAFKTSEMPPLASIAQIISSVSAAPVLIKTGISSEKSDGVVRDETLIDKKGFSGTATPGSSFSCPSLGASKRKGKKRPFKDEICDSAHASISGIDLESCGELPSVEKMLATTDANKFSSYLQLRQMEPEKEQQSASEEEKEGKEDKEKARPQGKGKKNAYSNSVQKMRCPYCPRVFPWTSSLQRHMLTHTGQKPFPCPQCDALFSTKSNCERHLLRKHGLSSRNTLQNTGSHPKTRVDEGSQGSTDGVSDGEPTVMLHDVDPIKEHKIITDDMDLTEQANNINTELSELEKVPESAQPFEEVHINPNENDDSESKKSVDLNVATEPTEHKMAETEQEPPKVAEPERASSKEFPHTCSVCKKTFRHGTTLSRHQKIHLQDNQNDDGIRKEKDQRTLSSKPLDTSTLPLKEAEQGTGEAEKEENSSVVESDAEEEEKDGQKDDRNEEEDGCSSELDSPGCRPDKRKKICNVCSKRFWSLQDLTRHMRSHTGERPYQCQTCDRTFTLKHSLVRHQRIHQKNPDDRGTDETDGARDDSAVDGEDLRCSSGSESETLAENETGNSNQTEEAIEKVDESVVKEEKESTAEASKKPQTEELAKLDAKAPEPKDATAPSLKDKQTC